jgi:hypothetical protein
MLLIVIHRPQNAQSGCRHRRRNCRQISEIETRSREPSRRQVARKAIAPCHARGRASAALAAWLAYLRSTQAAPAQGRAMAEATGKLPPCWRTVRSTLCLDAQGRRETFHYMATSEEVRFSCQWSTPESPCDFSTAKRRLAIWRFGSPAAAGPRAGLDRAGTILLFHGRSALRFSNSIKSPGGTRSEVQGCE